MLQTLHVARLQQVTNQVSPLAQPPSQLILFVYTVIGPGRFCMDVASTAFIFQPLLFCFFVLLYLVSSNLSPTPTLYLSALRPLFSNPQHGYPPNSQSPSAHFPCPSPQPILSFSLLTPPPFRSASPPPLQPADWTPLFFRAYARFCPRVSKNTSWTLDWTVFVPPCSRCPSAMMPPFFFFASHQHHHRYHAFIQHPRPCSVPQGVFSHSLRQIRKALVASAAVPTYHISFI